MRCNETAESGLTGFRFRRLGCRSSFVCRNFRGVAHCKKHLYAIIGGGKDSFLPPPPHTLQREQGPKKRKLIMVSFSLDLYNDLEMAGEMRLSRPHGGDGSAIGRAQEEEVPGT